MEYSQSIAPSHVTAVNANMESVLVQSPTIS
jgi:hypothetical protein